MAPKKRPAYAGEKAVARWRMTGMETVTVQELAAALRVREQTVRALPIPYTEVNGRRDRRYSVDEVERYLIASTRAAG